MPPIQRPNPVKQLLTPSFQPPDLRTFHPLPFSGSTRVVDPHGSVRPINTNTSPIINRVTQIANQQLGKPYVWAKAGPKSFDCSGLVDYAYRKAGVNFPVPKLSTWSALKMGISVKNKPLQPGDMIITHGGEHMVMYMGNGRVISAPHTGAVVQHQPLSKFAGDIVDIRRIVGAKQTKWTPPRR